MLVTATTVKKVLLLTSIFFLTPYLKSAEQSPEQEATRTLVIKATVKQIEACIVRDINLNDIQFSTAMRKDNLLAYLLLRQEAVYAIKEQFPKNSQDEKRKKLKYRLNRLASQLLYPPTPFDPRKDDPFVSDKAFDPYILQQHPEIRLQPAQKRIILFRDHFKKLVNNKELYDQIKLEYEEYQRKEQAKNEPLVLFLRMPIR